MWILFKDEYKKDNELIKPSKEFLDKLKMEMKKEEEKQKTYKLFNTRKIAAVAAILAVAIISAGSYNKMVNTEKNKVVNQAEISKEHNKTNSNNKSDEGQQGNLFNNSSWYDSNMTSEEIFSVFVKRLSSKDDLKELSVSDTEDFTDSDPMDERAVNEVISLLKDGRKAEDDSSDLKKNPKYYMASFKNGDIIKFIIYDNKYFECKEFKGRFSVGS